MIPTYAPTQPYTLTPVLPKPERILPPLGWRPQATDTPARIKHDTTWRLVDKDSKLKMTNEIQPLRPYKQGAVDWRSKITMKLAQRPLWVERFISLMGLDVWGLFKGHGFGWMDFPAPNDELSFNMLQCGGNLVNVIGKSGGYALIQAQDFYDVPDQTITPVWMPHLFVKQVLITANLRVIIDKTNVGDLYIPLVSPVVPALELAKLEFYPAVPFDCKIDGWDATVTQLSFAGSNTYGYVTAGLPEGWYVLEEMEVIGDPADPNLGGTQDDRIIYADILAGMPCPPPVVDYTWTRQG